MKKKIYVNKHIIKSNKKKGENEPCVSVRTYKGALRAHEVKIFGESKVVYGKKELSCGAQVWVETDAPVELIINRNTKETTSE